jgi:hypothetical protein
LAAQLAACVGKVADLGSGMVDDKVELAVDEIVQRQRDSSLGMGDEANRPVRAADPGRDLVRVIDCRGEADELNVIGTEND